MTREGPRPLTLYSIRGTRAFRPRWLMEEIGLRYELVRMTRADLAAPWYRAIDPLGRVPMLVDGPVTVVESSAICLWLAERHGGPALSPPVDGQPRADLLRWMFYAQASLEPPVETVLRQRHPKEFTGESVGAAPRAEPCDADLAAIRFRALAEPLRQTLAGRSFLLGPEISVADIVVGDVLAWARAVALLDGESVLSEYVERLRARPAYRRARSE